MENRGLRLYELSQKFRTRDKELNSFFVEIINLKQEKNKLVFDGEFERAGKLRERESQLKSLIYGKLVKLFPLGVTDTDIYNVMKKHISPD